MSLPYAVRLLCLCLATFFVVHLALGMAAWLLAPAAMRVARRLRSHAAARLLLAVRLFPLAASACLVAGVSVPSYLWLEPRGAEEEVGFACIAAALVAGVLGLISTARALRASVDSFRYSKRSRRLGRLTQVPGEISPVWVVDDSRANLVLAGVIRPRILVSRAVVDALSAEQLAVALRHERAHRVSRDNLKRLLLLLAPEFFPLSRRGSALARAWSGYAERAADDGAVAGDPLRSLSLAEALVRVARLGPASRSLPLATCFTNGTDLPARVERLLGGVPPGADAARRMPALRAIATIAALAGALALMLRPATLDGAHRLFEQLMHQAPIGRAAG